MAYACGIYGYQITRTIQIADLEILPLESEYQKATALAEDKNSCQLTAILKGKELPTDDFLFNLEAVLSFIEHSRVFITSPTEATENEDCFLLFNKEIPYRRKSGGGAVIGNDTFFNNSRELFIHKAMSKLQDKDFCEKSKFNIFFFKCVEALRSDFLDVQYFLLFSGLETFARAIASDEKIRDNRNASVPICKLLQSYGFDVSCDKPKDLKRAISSYTHIRNALFHNSKITVEKNVTEYKLTDYFPNFKILVSLVILKAVDFDDEFTNWNRWIDFQF